MARAGWLDRTRQRYLDSAARAMHDRLLARPDTFRTAPSTWVLDLLSVLVIGLLAVSAAGLVWAGTHAETMPMRVAVGLGALAWLGFAWPGVVRLPGHAAWLSQEEAPALHQLVDQLANQVGVRPPTLIGVDLEFNASVGSRALGRGNYLLIGLPLWSSLDLDQAVGVLGHELGHLRGGDTTRDRFQRIGTRFVDRWVRVLRPDDFESAASEVRVLESVLRLVLTVITLPLAALQLVVERIGAMSSQHREYLSDRRAAQVVGSSAVAGGLAALAHPELLITHARSAALRGEDPAAALRSRPRAEDADVRRLIALQDTGYGAFDSHPPTHLRLSLLMSTATSPQHRIDPEVARRTDDELQLVVAGATKDFREALIAQTSF